MVAIGFAIAIAKLEPPAPRTFAIAADRRAAAYHAYAERYRQILARDGFELRVIETAGSVENLELLTSGEGRAGAAPGRRGRTERRRGK